jgi:beta-lactam-binding protein with PASTA domain
MSEQETGSYSASIPNEDIAKTVRQDLSCVDSHRAAILSHFEILSAARASGYAREQDRLNLKLGADSARVEALAGKIAFNQQLQTAVKLEASRANIDPPTPIKSKTAFVFHGFVLDASGQAIPGLTIALYDEQGTWIRGLGYGCTSSEGYFLLQGEAANASATEPRSATIRVYEGKKLIFTEPEPLEIIAGGTADRIIVIGDEVMCPPPPRGNGGTPPAPIRVPDLVGKTETVATSEAGKANFTTKSSPLGAAPKDVGHVLEQTPAGGALAAHGSTVAIVVGVAEPKIPVPGVIGQPLRDATTILENANLTLGAIDPSGAPPESKVVKQSPAAGAEVERGTAVDLVVEKPAETVSVPDVVKRNLEEAKKSIDQSGLTVGTISPADAAAQAIVLDQKPPAGTTVKPRSAVDLTMEKKQNKEQVAVPSLVRLMLYEAKQALEKAGLKPGKLNPGNASEKHVVTSQAPEAGTKVDAGSRVNLDLHPSSSGGRTKDTPKKKRPKKSRKKRGG